MMMNMFLRVKLEQIQIQNQINNTTRIMTPCMAKTGHTELIAADM
jgi:hypothetical protein